MGRGRLAAIAAAILAALPRPAAASPPLDCPLRDAPFSVDSPLLDVLLSTAARNAVDDAAPGWIGRAPAFFTGTKTPGFSAILSLRELTAFTPLSADRLAVVDRALRMLRVTAADRLVRCARYDDDAAAIHADRGRPNVLLFEKMTGFRDGPSVDAARATFQAMARRKGWHLAVTDRGGAIRDTVLKHVDAIVWNNVSGDVLTLRQRAALKRFVQRGGGFVAIHGAAGDPVTFWPWYVDTLIGARFKGHPFPNQFQDARVSMEARAGVLAAGLPAEWVMKDEWYSFKNNPRGSSTVVAALDERTYKPEGLGKQDLSMGDHPIAWMRCVGRGRTFYSAIGHRPEVYADPRYGRLLDNAVTWAVASKREGCDLLRR